MKLKEGGEIHAHIQSVVCSYPPTLGWEGEIKHTQKSNPSFSQSAPTPPLDTSPPSPPGGRACCGEGEQLKTLVSREENNKRTGPRKQRLKNGRHSADETKVSSVFHSYLAPPVPAHPLVPWVISVLVTHTESGKGGFPTEGERGQAGG